MATWRNFFGGNSYTVQAGEAENNLRKKEPLLLHEDERIEMAFKSAFDPRDKSYLTTHRILFKDGKGIGGKRKNFNSIPYKSVKGFSVETSGAFLDGDTELKVWNSSVPSVVRIEFGKGEADLFAVQQFMNDKVLRNFVAQGTQDYVPSDSPAVDQSNQNVGSLGMMVDWLGANAHQLEPAQVERRFKTESPVLMADERVELAFKCGRDYYVMTHRRILVVDVQGLMGQKIEFQSIPWACVRGFSVQTAGAFLDRDTEMCIHTNILAHPEIRQDFRKGGADLWAINTYISNKVLGKDTVVQSGLDLRQGHIDPDTSWWGRSNNRPLDAVEMNHIFHADPPILQTSETVEMAFKGRRDFMLFTTKRIIKIDRKGIVGKRTEYSSIPWKSVVGFGVKTAGKHFDKDAEATLWTDMMFESGSDDDPPTPGMSTWEIDFNKDLVDIIEIKKYLNQRCLKHRHGDDSTPVIIPQIERVATGPSAQEHGFEKLFSKIGNDQRAIDPAGVDFELHNSVPILLEDENVIMAFKGGRDTTVFTNVRVLSIDVQGWSGKKVSYISIPYSSVRAFSAESAGAWDRDSEIDLYTRNTWSLSKFSQDFRKGKADIVAIQKFLSAMILCIEPVKEDLDPFFEGAGLIPAQAATAGDFVAWLTSNSKEVENLEEMNDQLHRSPPILLTHEKCDKVYKKGRDLYVYTNMRVLRIDVKGLTGQKVEYFSVPFQWVSGFAVETAGHLDRDAEVYIHTDIPSKKTMDQDILVKSGDVMEMHQYLTNKVILE